MKPILQQVLATAAGVLIAGAYIAIVQALNLQMDWATLGVGAFVLFGLVYVLGKPA